MGRRRGGRGALRRPRCPRSPLPASNVPQLAAGFAAAMAGGTTAQIFLLGAEFTWCPWHVGVVAASGGDGGCPRIWRAARAAWTDHRRMPCALRTIGGVAQRLAAERTTSKETRAQATRRSAAHRRSCCGCAAVRLARAASSHRRRNNQPFDHDAPPPVNTHGHARRADGRVQADLLMRQGRRWREGRSPCRLRQSGRCSSPRSWAEHQRASAQALPRPVEGESRARSRSETASPTDCRCSSEAATHSGSRPCPNSRMLCTDWVRPCRNLKGDPRARRCEQGDRRRAEPAAAQNVARTLRESRRGFAQARAGADCCDSCRPRAPRARWSAEARAEKSATPAP